MGRRVKRVAEAEKGREKERVEKERPAMTTWREGGRGIGVPPGKSTLPSTAAGEAVLEPRSRLPTDLAVRTDTIYCG